MTKPYLQSSEYLYTYTHPPEESSLCALEQRTLFGVESDNLIKSTTNINPSRSPFIKGKLSILFSGESVQAIAEQVDQIELRDQTFKVLFIKINDLSKEQKIEFEEQRTIEKEIGWNIIGEAQMKNPDILFGIVPFEGRWYFGTYQQSESVWLHHLKKPYEYSTALSTRLARTIVNIAIPNPACLRIIDPCCGIGTVLVEALSMGIQIVGSDRNPLAVKGARENITYFHYDGIVEVKDIADEEAHYDVAIIDMPYNLAAQSTLEEQYTIIQHARRIANRVVILTIEDMDEMIGKAGFTIVDRGVANKGEKALFSRQVIVCE
ncbi:methyltransferase domain-containing protein [Gracilibacillus sp. S3-1-1]|uniref:Methyltransferase domain-containing protein n=1 Tax=Gracilibacillus pellucidus TaxID=3095368 RepID=A0ACC6M8S2_9BACI|nr:methyltransferase domain-containing protein [Gracilibacillus sp. S3-1-1]MDX8047281.1 methyltransferase domain-containing protein [Gracilibacillus sp. S3-1-1]